MTHTEPANAARVDACTLPGDQQPLRIAEFDRLFAQAVTGVHRSAPTCLRVTLVPDPQVAARAADLAARETRCCSFFTFTLTLSAASVQLSIEVSDANVAVLDAMAQLPRADRN